MENEQIHIAMASNRRYLPGLRATTVSLINAVSEPKRLVFHVFSDGLTDEDKKSVEDIAKRFGYEGRFDFRTPDMSRLTGAFKEYNGSHTTFLRLFFPELLAELKWVLWTDVDILWFRDPAKLWNERDESVSVVWAPDILSTRKAACKQAKKWRNDFDMCQYACAGVILMNLQRMRDLDFIKKSIDFVEKWNTPIFADQDILNELCYGDAKIVDSRWNLLYPISTIDDGVVVHFNGIGPKFNDTSYSGIMPLYEIWFRFVHQVINGHKGEQVCPLWKRAIFTVVSMLYPFRKIIAFFTDPIHPWCSDFIQRTLLFCWLRRKDLWQ